MKLWSSFVKEIKLASRGFYFYIEIFMAVVMLLVLLFVIPDSFNKMEDEYFYLDIPEQFRAAEEKLINSLEDLDGKPERVEVEVGDATVSAELYTSEEKNYFIVESIDAAKQIAEQKHVITSTIIMSDAGEMRYAYYLQGYETSRLKNLLLILHGGDDEMLKEVYDNQDIRPLSSGFEVLSDRENLLPVMLAFNGSLMGLFIIAAYIFLDKKEGVIKAYAITASAVWQYLMSKVMVLTTTALLTSLMIVLPIMGFEINYGLLLILLITTGFFASTLGLLLASFFDDFSKAFGTVYMIMMAMLLPSIAYYIPSWEPTWIKLIPSYFIIEGFNEIFVHGNTGLILLISAGYTLAGLVLFFISNRRYKKTLWT